MKTNTMRVWNFAAGGRLVISIEVADMEEAATHARRWNADPDTAERDRVEIIANAPVAAHGTRVRAVQ